MRHTGASQPNQVEPERANSANRAPSTASDLIAADLAPRTNSAVWRKPTTRDGEIALEHLHLTSLRRDGAS